MKIITLPVIAALFALTLILIPVGGSSSALAQEPDACGIGGVFDVPDSGANFNFTNACIAHDDCYAAGGSEAERNACDQQFLGNMRASCGEMWPSQPLRLRICNGVANTYYLGVHLFGWLFFPYGETP